jgi:hypothetical protein
MLSFRLSLPICVYGAGKSAEMFLHGGGNVNAVIESKNIDSVTT